jgi:putative ABC transport system permease protein
MVMKSNKTRSCLTMLGIIIGISAVIILNSIGKGQIELIKEVFNEMGTNVIIIQKNRNYDSVKYSNFWFKAEDYDFLKKNPNVDKVSVLTSPNMVVVKPNDFNLPKDAYLQARTVNSDFFAVGNYKFLEGRNFSENEKNRFAVIEKKFADILFGSAEKALGKNISFHFQYWYDNTTIFNFTIIGVAESPTAKLEAMDEGGRLFTYLYIPSNIFEGMTRYAQKSGYYSIFCRLNDGVDLYKASPDIIDQLAKFEDVPNELITYTPIAEFMSRTNDSLKKANLIVGVVSGISLLVGGIGIMVIMLVTVTERTKEIGIRKAIGARNRDIMLQFLIESIVLTMSGGVIGVLVGCIGSQIAGYFTAVPPVIDLNIIIISVLVTILIGVIAGLYPAKKAADLNPIDALRHE